MAGTTHFNIPMPVVGDTVADEFNRLRDEAWPIVDAILEDQLDRINGKAPFSHTHTIAGVVGLEAALEGKMPADRVFGLDDLNDVSGAVDAPANYILAKNGAGQWVPSTALAALGPHQHSLAEVAGLVAALSARPDRAEVAAGLDVLSDELASTTAQLVTDIQQRGMSIGTVFMHLFPVAPSGALALNGQAVTPVWAELRTMILSMGAPWGMAGSDPKLPDLITNGEFLRAGGPGGLTVGIFQLDLIKEHFHHDGVGTTSIHPGRYGKTTGLPNNAYADTDGQSNADVQSSAYNTSSVGGSETRPRAFTGLPCVKAYGTVDPEGMADLSALLTAIADKPTAEAGASNTHVMSPLSTRWSQEAFAAKILHVRDQKATNTAGGSAAAGVNIRTLNTVVVNGISGASLASDKVTLPAGTYDVLITAPAHNVGRHRIALRNSTTLANYIIGTSELSGSGGVHTSSSIKGRFVLSATTTVEIIHIIQTAYASQGLGVEDNFAGYPEVYTDAVFRKVG